MTQPLQGATWPRGFHVLIAAQFCSALADNALLIVAIALLAAQQMPGWWAPLLKFSFTIAYVVLAPGVGVLADRWPKARMMMAMNALKVAGVALLLAQGHPLLAMAVVGVGAAAYAPAKYGLVTELVGPRLLVAANGWIEVSTVCAVLLGTVLGGVLVSPLLKVLAATWLPGQPALALALWLLLGLYGLAALLNLWVPDSGARYRRARMHPLALWRGHWRANRRLWADTEGGLSMAVTTLFWGAAAVLQFAVLRWAGEVLGLPLDRAATCRVRWRWASCWVQRWPGAGSRWRGPPGCCHWVCCWACWCLPWCWCTAPGWRCRCCCWWGRWAVRWSCH